ncbi:hypothetical protein HDU92_007647 [Lobulomyces angularis]|nr:hypothetical protein HDU92_007647 [Lobulomyces angularis]
MSDNGREDVILLRQAKSLGNVLQAVNSDCKILIDKKISISQQNLLPDTMEFSKKHTDFLNELNLQIDCIKKNRILQSEEDTNYSDSELFPGYSFSTKGNKLFDFPITIETTPHDVLKQMSDEELSTFREITMQKYNEPTFKHNLIESRERLLNKKFFNSFHQEVKKISYELGEAELNIKEYKNIFQSSINELKVTIPKIKNYLSDNIPPYAVSMKNMYNTFSLNSILTLRPDDLLSIPEEILNFKLPIDDFLMMDRNYRLLYDEFMFYQDQLLNALCVIEELEIKIIPLHQQLCKLEFEEERIQSIEQELLELDILDKTEKLVYHQEKEREKNKQLKCREKLTKKETEMELMSEDETFKNEMKKMEEMKRNRRKFIHRFKRILDMVCKQELKSTEATAMIHKLNKKKKDLEILVSECKIIRQHLKKTSISEKKENKIYMKEREIMDKKKTDILGKIIKEEAKRKLADQENEMINRINKSLDNRNPNPENAFAYEEIIPRKEKKTIKKSLPCEKASKKLEAETINVTENTMLGVENSLETVVVQKVPEKKHLPPPQHKFVKPAETSKSSITSIPFTADPSIVLFKDYDPEKVYKRVFTLTNTSSCVNAFRLHPISEDFQDYFVISYKPIGRMSAGMMAELEVTFNAPSGFNENLEIEVTGFAEIGGDFSFKIGCQKKIAFPFLKSISEKNGMMQKFHRQDNGKNDNDASITKDVLSAGLLKKKNFIAEKISDDKFLIDFGSCLGGEKRTVRMVNYGALKTDFQIEVSQEHLAISNDNLTNPLETFFEVEGKSGSLHSFGNAIIEITFRNLQCLGVVRERITIKFSSSELQPIVLDCIAEMVNYPITIEKNLVDFGTCVYQNSYRDDGSIVLKNDGNVSLKYSISSSFKNFASKADAEKNANSMKLGRPSKSSLVLNIPGIGDFEVIPKQGFIQSKSTSALRFKFTPYKLSGKDVADGPKLFCVPLELKYISSNHNCILNLTLKGIVTSDAISFYSENFNQNVLNFGNCSVDEVSINELKIFNHSHLPQSLLFETKETSLNLKEDGFVTSDGDQKKIFLDPRTETIVNVAFCPLDIGEQTLKFTLKKQKQNFNFSCVGVGITPLLQFEKNEIQFSETGLGSLSSAKVYICKPFVKDNRPDHLPWKRKVTAKEIVSETAGASHLSKLEEEVSFEFLKPKIVDLSCGGRNEEELYFHYTANDECPLRIFPAKGSLVTGEKIAVDITLSPTIKLQGVVSAITQRQELILEKKKADQEQKEELARREQEKRDLEAAAMLSAKRDKKGGKNSVAHVLAKLQDPAEVEVKKIEEVEFNPPMNYFDNYVDTTLTIIVPCLTKKRDNKFTRKNNFLKQVNSKFEAENQNESEEMKNENLSLDTQMIFLKILAPIVRPNFIVEAWSDFLPLKATSATENLSNSLPKNEDEVPNPIEDCLFQLTSGKLDFDRVPIGKSLVQTIKIRNTTDKEIQITSTLLNPQGPFYLAKALRSIKPNQFFVVKVSFEPTKIGANLSMMQLKSDGSQITIKLNGEGVIPSIIVEPVEKRLTFSDIVVGESSTNTFKIHNPCHFPIKYSFSFKEKDNSICDSEDFEPCFKVFPTECVLAPGIRQEVSVTFDPKNESDLFHTILDINFWGKSEDHTIDIFGRAWETSTALLGYDNLPLSMDPQYIVDGQNDLELPSSQDIAALISKSKTSIGNEHKSKLSLDKSVDSAELLNSNGKDRVKAIDTRFVTLKCSWKKLNKDSDTINQPWTVDFKELQVANLKTTQKLENTGKGTKAIAAQYTIERIKSKFEYVEETGHFVVKAEDNATTAGYLFEIEPTAGTIEFGTSKTLNIRLIEAILEQSKLDANQEKDKEKKKKNIDKSSASAIASVPVSTPIKVETYFRVRLKGGYHAVEPKGPTNANDKRDWILKVVVE